MLLVKEVNYDRYYNTLIKELKDEKILSAKEIADRYYTIRNCIDHRLVLFKIICHTYPKLAWKTKQHFDGGMFDDSFLVGITTPLGDATYHFKWSIMMNLQ
jgi:hypothetical protein